MEKQSADPNLGRSRGQENVIIVDTLTKIPPPQLFSQTLAFMEHNKITEGFFFSRIHLVLNKTLTDDTSVKQAQIKTFLCFIQFC